MQTCPYCGSTNVEYMGIEDGAGEYGELVVDTYRCRDCAMRFDGYEYDEVCMGNEGYDCIMCGKPTAKYLGERCSECEQVWNS